VTGPSVWIFIEPQQLTQFSCGLATRRIYLEPPALEARKYERDLVDKGCAGFKDIAATGPPDTVALLPDARRTAAVGKAPAAAM